MSDRRVTQVLTDVEYATPTNVRQATQVLAMVEYKTPTNFRQITQVLIQVEYSRPYFSTTLRKLGPPAQTV
jgi:hypothetical protein